MDRVVEVEEMQDEAVEGLLVEGRPSTRSKNGYAHWYTFAELHIRNRR